MTEDTQDRSPSSEMVFFADRLAASNKFLSLFQEGMALVEETATYLDGDGRSEAKLLERPASLTYATESMRLTTRLMQLASWLLLQRAVNDGEMSSEQASSEKNKVRLDKLATSVGGASWEGLPERLRDLIDRSLRLQQRIAHLDKMLYSHEERMAITANTNDNPVVDQLHKLQAAFNAH